MTETEPIEDNESDEERGKTNKTFYFVVALLVLVAAVSIYSRMQPLTYKYTSEVAGINVYSQIPLEELQYRKNIALYNSTDPAAITCNFELSAISQEDRSGYKIIIEEGEHGIYIQRDKAYIKGKTYGGTLKACNIFSCIREDIECPPNLWDIRASILKEKKINIVIDSEVRGSAVRGYGDIMAALGYIQGENMMTDLNGDGRVERWEIEENLIKIFPHIMEGEECQPQPISTSFQKLNATNETFNCNSLSPAIILQKSDENRIEVVGDRMIIYGDDEHIGSAAIIVRDIVSPEFIRSLYKID